MRLRRVLKAPVHDAIHPYGACQLPCTRVNRKVCHVARMSRTRANRVKRNYSSFYCRAESAARAVRLPNQSAADYTTTFTLYDYERETGSVYLNVPILLRNIFVSVNMEFFCRINNKPRNALPVMVDCSQYGTSRLKKISPMP